MHAGNGTPEERIDAARVNPGINGGEACGLAIDGDFGFAKTGAAATEEFTRDVVGDAGVPEFVVGLALGDDVEIGALDIGREGDGAGKLVGGGVQKSGAAIGVREGVNGVGRERSTVVIAIVAGGRVQLDSAAAENDAGEGGIDKISEIDLAGLWVGEESGIVGEVALDVPEAGNVGGRLGRGAEINVGVAKIDGGGAVELAAGGDVEIGGEDNFGPGAGAFSRRRVLEGLERKIGKLEIGKERDDTRLGVGARDERIGGGGVGRAEGELCFGAASILGKSRTSEEQDGSQRGEKDSW